MPWRWPWLLPLLLMPLAGDASPLVAPVAPAGLVLSELIGHFEPAVLDRAGLEAQMQERISRRRRDASSAFTFHEPISLRVATPHREFRMSLLPDREVFADNPEFETSKGQISYDATRVFQGTLEDDETATVRGVMTEEGLFDGTISTSLEEFYVEPVSRYLGPGDEINRKPNFDTVVYRGSDVRRPLLGSKDGIWCASQRLSERQRRSKRWFQDDGSQQPPFSSSNSGTTHFSSNRTIFLVTGRPLSVPGSGGTQRNANNHFHTPTHTHRPSIIVTSSGKGLDPSLTFAEEDDNVDKNVLSGGERSSSGGNGASTSGPYGNRKRASVDPNKTTCMLYLQADHLFYKKYGSEEACIEVMTRHVQRVNAIYKATDFNQDGKPDNISFMIKRIKVHTMEALKDPSYRFPQNYGVEKFLELFSEEDYDAFCLAYMFTYRDFEMGTLGLAWTGDLKNAGGVCEKNGHYRGSLKSLNTGIVTLLNYGKHVPPAVSHVTLAHEIGHNFGSPHDPEQCTPGGEDGNYIMFARATSGDKRNNNKFSPCSLNSINPVLNAKARSSKGCFSEPQAAICGNGVVEPGEECDCGWEEDCRDQCCHPQRKHPSPEEPPCKLTSRSICSPSQGPCCTAECRLRFGDKCRDDNGCRDSSFCDGRAPQCPPSINKPNKTICNQEFVCFMGECTGSICLAYGLESCQCIPGPKDPITKACELCCKLPGDDQPCLSSFFWNTPPYDIPDLFSKPGTPCNNYNGYCDVFQRCREVDPSGPLATLRKLLLSDESLATFKLWIVQHWYAVALIVSAVITLLILSTRFLGKRPNTKLKAITIIHSSTTETVRLPAEGGEGRNGVTVHPGVRSKLPLKKRVREARARRRPRGKSAEHIENPKEGGKSKKEKSKKTKPNRTQNKNPPKEQTAVPTNVVTTPTEDSKKKNKTHLKVIDYSNAQEKNKASIATGALGVTTAEPPADPIGKVKSWLVTNHPSHAPSSSVSAVPKSKSSPAGLAMAANRSGTKPRTSSTTPKYSPSDSKDKLRIHVVYKPPFRFSLKLRRPDKPNASNTPAAGATTSAPTNGSPRKSRVPGQRVLLRTREREYRSGVAKRAHKRNKKLNSPKKTSAERTSSSKTPTPSAPPPDSADVVDTAVPSDLEVLLSESEFLFSDG